MARVVIISNPEMAIGYRLAGVETVVARSASEAASAIRSLLSEPDVGVIAVDASYMARMDETLQREIESRISPIVVALPSAGMGGEAETRRAQIARLLRRSIGYQISFPGEGGEPS
ncbi:MAG: hypothetical protein Kow0047_07010 [Anaerolineae bacterium]